SAEIWPFEYGEDLRPDLVIYRTPERAGPRLEAFLSAIDRTQKRTVDFVVDLNRRLAREIAYVIRMEAGVQSPEETFERGSGSCRDSSWLLVQILRNLGLAARFVSGYLIQLKPDLVALDGSPGTDHDLPICTPGPRSIFRAPAGSASIRPRASWPAKAIFRLPRRRTIATPRRFQARRVSPMSISSSICASNGSPSTRASPSPFRKKRGRPSTLWARRSTRSS